jgi:hypothetical protein
VELVELQQHVKEMQVVQLDLELQLRVVVEQVVQEQVVVQVDLVLVEMV